GRTSDGNGSHASTLKSPSYTKSVSWQHYPGIAGGDFEDEFEVDDDATPDEIHDEAKDIFFNYCNYSYHEIKDEEEEQNG
ncbi:hypothetical protein SM925_10760, partial [Escherichia coli]|nr:hypothetical protein [Escherichia coli]